MRTQLQLTVTVAYGKRLTQTQKAEAKRRLANAGNHLAGEGLLTGDGPELDCWQVEIIDLKPTKANAPTRQTTRR